MHLRIDHKGAALDGIVPNESMLSTLAVHGYLDKRLQERYKKRTRCGFDKPGIGTAAATRMRTIIYIYIYIYRERERYRYTQLTSSHPALPPFSLAAAVTRAELYDEDRLKCSRGLSCTMKTA